MIVRTFDADLINGLIRHPDIFPWVTEDTSPPAEQIDIGPMLQNPKVYALAIVDGRECWGAFVYFPQNETTHEVHTMILPKRRGKLAIQDARESLRWMIDNNACAKVITHVPFYNKPAYVFAKRVGMKDEGVERESYLKHGELQSQWLLGLTRREILCLS